MSLDSVVAALADAGLGLAGTLSIAEYDSIVPEPWRSLHLAPGARGALVVGNAGRRLWERFDASPERALESDPLDAYTRRVLARSAALCSPPASVGFYADRRDGVYLPLVALARRAGFGALGRVGVLIHPVYGPWIGIRAVLLVAESFEPREPAAWSPCDGCEAPCASACHGGLVGASGIDAHECYRVRLTLPECALVCDARRACVVGREHAYSAEQTAHHSRIRRAAQSR